MSNRIPTEVYAEMTPNPATMKFVTNRMLIEGGQQVEFTNQEQCKEASPLAAELFNFPFVKAVFISGNYVAVAKDDTLGWEMIMQQLRDYIREWLVENEIAVAFVPEKLQPSASFEESDASEDRPEAIDYSGMVPTDFDSEIRHLLDEFVRPAVEQDGGAIDFKAFHEGKVYVQLRGACSGCPSSMQTLKGGIESLLRSKLEAVQEVVAEEM